MSDVEKNEENKEEGLSRKERMKIPRTPIPEQDPKERARNFDEVALGYSDDQAMMEAKRCIQCKKPKCIGGCPVEIDIPAFVKYIEEGDPGAAIAKLKEKTSFPAVCGRVCPQEEQCEKVCVVGKKGEPVAIGRLERYAADWEVKEGKSAMPEIAPSKGKRVGVVGSGPAGVTCAGELAKMGYEVVIYEALHKPGGVLTYGIPEFRLPKEIVFRECEYVVNLGAELKTDYVIGKTITIDDMLANGHDAIFIANGAGLPMFMNIPGENLNGVFSANEFLTRANLMKSYKFPEYDTPIKVGKKVAVVGGGNVAMDAARTALRLGADVHLIYRRSRDEMPARNEEIHHAEEEGIQFHLLTNPTQIISDNEGWVEEIECIQMELGEPDDSGRRRPVAVDGSEYRIPIDVVIMSIGTGSNPVLTQATPDLELNKWGNIVADEATGETSMEGVFAGGDIVTGAATVILAMGAGKIGARSIDRYLQGEPLLPEPEPEPEEAAT
jgi:glutamate synthase (NADPH/NADH) small chain